MSGKHVVIFKNDAVGDLVHSLKAINNICNEKNVDKITIYISKLSEKFNFLINNQKIFWLFKKFFGCTLFGCLIKVFWLFDKSFLVVCQKLFWLCV